MALGFEGFLFLPVTCQPHEPRTDVHHDLKAKLCERRMRNLIKRERKRRGTTLFGEKIPRGFVSIWAVQRDCTATSS